MKMPYCCSCGEKVPAESTYTTGAIDETSSYICNECEWEVFCNIPDSASSYCSVCGIVLKNMADLKAHICEEIL